MSNASFKMNGVEVFSENAQTVTVKNINVDANDTTTPSMCKAWVNFNGTLDENSGSLTVEENVLIRASYNVSSVYYNGTGDYTVNFENAMPDENYCAVATTKENDDTTTQTTVVMFHTQTPSSCRIFTVRANVSAINAQNVNVAIFR